jgi:predicted TIM-barrel fold metal-dependent hydrolase
MNPSTIVQQYIAQGKSADCPIIDVHGHVGPFYSAYLPSSPLENILHSMDRCGVQRIVCSHHAALTYDAAHGNELMQQTNDEHPSRFLGYWLFNPNHPEIIESQLKAFENARGFVGFKLWPDYLFVKATSTKYTPVLEYSNDHELLVLVHIFGGSAFNPPGWIAELAERYPHISFIMGHAGYGEWEVSVGEARDLPNLYLDLASVVQSIDFALMPGGSFMPAAPVGVPQVSGIIEYMVETAGSHKVLFASDLPWYSQHYHAGAVLFARIDDQARRNIFYRNAQELLERV